LENEFDVATVWDELWQELHHQGDVGTASYAAVPHLLRVHRARDVPDWNTFGLIGVIELARSARQNPKIPAWLSSGYRQAWNDVVQVACRDLMRSEDATLTSAALGAIAVARGLRPAGEMLLAFTTDELEEILRMYLDRA
jgi:hypothetical protein